MININVVGFKRRFLIFLFLFLIPITIVGFILVTGYQYIPVDVTVGSCTMDYTSPSTYTDRVSPLKSIDKSYTDDGELVLCYSSPSANGRTIFGELVPFDELWRFGANEPTRLYTTKDFIIGDLYVPRGRYSIYVIPGRFEWEFFLSKSITHWGNDISERVRKKEIGSFTVESEYSIKNFEDFNIDIRNEEMIINWEKTMVRIPIKVSEKEGDKTNTITKYVEDLSGDQ